MKIHLISSPPFGDDFWRGVQNRLAYHGHDVQIHSPIEHAASIREACIFLKNHVQPQDVLVAHGLGVPLALQYASENPINHAILSNGPIENLDPISASFAKLPSLLQKIYLHPTICFRYFQSSLGMRRAVVNPYVMDKEMVASACAPLTKGQTRSHMIQYLKEISSFSPPASIQSSILAIWGDHDLLYPISISMEIQNRYPQTTRLDIEGGKLLHPIERPWAMADIMHTHLS